MTRTGTTLWSARSLATDEALPANEAAVTSLYVQGILARRFCSGTLRSQASMRTPVRALLTALLLFLAMGGTGAEEMPGPLGPSLVGLDHVPVAVSDLEQAVATYDRFGFSMKPGRFHENGLRNSHVKFPDGSGVELISPPAEPVDRLTRNYSRFLQDGDGPAYVSFHARDTEVLTTALHRANLRFTEQGGLITPSDPNLDFIFFVQDNRSPTDRPEHFAHPNTAVAMTEIWLALDGPGRSALRQLLLALGATESSETVTLPDPAHRLAPTEARAGIFTVQNGQVVVVADTWQAQKGRRIVGVTFRARDLDVTKRLLGTAEASVPSSAAHGLWLRFEPP